jgi:hypothetical protein
VFAACHLDPYSLTFGSDGADAGGRPDARAGAADARPGGVPDADTTRPDARVILPNCTPSTEVCDGKDNDCDGVVDNGFDLMNDPANCGACGTKCARKNELGTCVAGQCTFACLPGYHDVNGDPKDGCEYFCIPTNGGTEVCDGIDNNCDGKVDEGTDLMNDPKNCGTCNHVCVALHATPTCAAGKCDYDRVKGCDPPYTDITDAIPGCEYLCQQYPPSATEDKCDNIDNNCNGIIDEGAPGGGQPCGSSVGECKPGVTACVAGTIICTGQVLPTAEVCDGKDNNCDGRIDEGFDKTSDPRHCGPDCTICDIPFAVPKCVPGPSGTGVCAIAACLPGHVDLDGDPNNGCEYACVLTGSEVCDGLDNDCNGKVDDALVPPAGLCAQKGACAGTVPVCGKPQAGCGTTISWRCPYGLGVEVDDCGNLLPQETLCDGIDGDCDGAIDDAFVNIGKPCDDGKIGVCKGTGTYQCSADHKSSACVITTPGQAPAAADTTCDGKDDDCDGMIDEDVVDTMAEVNDVASGHHFWIYTYEASRQDATTNSTGTRAFTRPCSKPNALPWSSVNHAEAAAACTEAGLRLCTEDEWEVACEGAARSTYPYGNTYEGDACNGADYDPNCAAPDDNHVMPTGAQLSCPPKADTCKSSYGVYDLSGNLKEWTSTQVGTGLFRVRGGAYDSVAPGLTCQFDFIAAATTYQYPNLGFRCCSDTAP